MGKKIVEIEINNFQIHEHLVIKPHPGVNAFFGENSSGKTAVLRAIMFVAFNRPIQNFDRKIRHGKRSALVKITMEDGSYVIRERGKDVNRYIISSPEIIKKHGKALDLNSIGTETPPEVGEVLGFHLIDLAKSKGISLNITGQAESAFLLKESAPDIARWIYSLTSLEDIRLAIDDLNTSYRQSKSSVNESTNLIAEIEAELERFSDLDELEEEAQALDSDIKLLEAQWDVLQNSWIGMAEKLRELKRLAVPVKHQKQKLASLLEIVTESELEQLDQRAATLCRMIEVKNGIAQAKHGMINAMAAKKKLDAIKRINLDECDEEVTKIQNMISLVTILEKNTRSIADIQQKMETVRNGQAQCELELAAIQKQLDQFEICPTCGREIDGNLSDHLMEELDG